MTTRAVRRRAEALKRARRAERFRDWHLPVPHALWARLRVVRAVDGRSCAEWARAVLAEAADRAILAKPGLAWARPHAPIYSGPVPGPNGHMVGAPVARTLGGERVLVIARFDGLDLPYDDLSADLEGLPGVAYLCDLAADGDWGVSMRRVVLRAVDVLAGDRLASRAAVLDSPCENSR